MEVAVSALRLAERNLHIYAESHHPPRIYHRSQRRRLFRGRIRSCSGWWIGYDFEVNLAVSRAVKLAEKNRLPASEAKPAVVDPHALRRSNERGFNVRIRISFIVGIARNARDHAVEG